MVTIFDRVREGLLTDPGVSRSGNIRVTSENAYFWENAIVDFARSHGVEELRFERRLLALEGNFFDELFWWFFFACFLKKFHTHRQIVI